MSQSASVLKTSRDLFRKAHVTAVLRKAFSTEGEVKKNRNRNNKSQKVMNLALG